MVFVQIGKLKPRQFQWLWEKIIHVNEYSKRLFFPIGSAGRFCSTKTYSRLRLSRGSFLPVRNCSSFRRHFSRSRTQQSCTLRSILTDIGSVISNIMTQAHFTWSSRINSAFRAQTKNFVLPSDNLYTVQDSLPRPLNCFGDIARLRMVQVCCC